LTNMFVAAAISCILQGVRFNGLTLSAPAFVTSLLPAVDRVWAITAGLASFTLSFFLSQAYAFWRTIYSSTRQVQGRLNDIGLMCATGATRGLDGRYTSESAEMLEDLARLVRLFNIMLYASVTTRFAPLRTSRGLRALEARGAIMADESEALLTSRTFHSAVLEWIVLLFNSAMADGRLCNSASGGEKVPLGNGFREQVLNLRAVSASIEDGLSGRMPLAYVQLVQVMTDILVSLTPLALIHSVGGIGAMLGTGVTTLFYSSTVVLAKMLLDPFDNDSYGGGGGISINVATLIQETNVGSERWLKGVEWVPHISLPQRGR